MNVYGGSSGPKHDSSASFELGAAEFESKNFERKMKMKKTEEERLLAGLLNGVCRENESNTPDFLLAEFIMSCVEAFELASNKREVWYGVKLDVSNDWEKLIMQAIGEASMCWSETPKGTFDDGKAKNIATKLLHDMNHPE